jgi:N-acetylglucosaminyl-diphospho-decaprenol L-rhamnosyltransferase
VFLHGADAQLEPQRDDAMSIHPHSVAIIIVTHNSSKFMDMNLTAVKAQTYTAIETFVVDSGSSDTDVLETICEKYGARLIKLPENVGFCAANNIGFKSALDNRFVLFLNPDCFLQPAFVEQAVALMSVNELAQYAAISGTLEGFSFEKKEPTGRYDSTGIFRSWYGKWFDRWQGRLLLEVTSSSPCEDVPALCGALMFCRVDALKKVLIRQREVFDETFYMYKEDIDLSLRLARAGWRLGYVQALRAHHCRGWQSDRSKVARKFRWMSAKNEVRVQWRDRSPTVFYSLLKCVYVGLMNG